MPAAPPSPQPVIFLFVPLTDPVNGIWCTRAGTVISLKWLLKKSFTAPNRVFEGEKRHPTVNSLASLPAQLESDCQRMTGCAHLRWAAQHPCCPEGRPPGPTCSSLVSLKMALTFPLKFPKQRFYTFPVWVLAKAKCTEKDSTQECLIKLHSAWNELRCILELSDTELRTQNRSLFPISPSSPSLILPCCGKTRDTLEPLFIMFSFDLGMSVS